MEDAKNYMWKVVGRRGERQIIRVNLNSEERERDGANLQDTRKGTRSAARPRI